MTSVSDLFTPVDELRLTEPYYSTGGLPVSAGTTFSQKTPVMVLDEAARRVYGVPPDYQLISEVPAFGFSCRLMNRSATGCGKTKKAAKHQAARALLHELIEANLQLEFGIPGETKQAAHQAVDGLAVGDVRVEPSDEDLPPSTGQNENHSGKLLQLCHKNKLEAPEYSYKEEGPSNDRTFTTTCKVGGQEVVGVAKTKKVSKNIASQKMLAIIEKGIVNMNKEPDLDRDADEDENPSVGELQCNIPHASDPMTVVSEILSDTKRFESPTQEYRILENKCAFGEYSVDLHSSQFFFKLLKPFSPQVFE
ncbi:unnamed protein product [Angiostrongylus costaricensis]|uniref:DRBM domain-containing protein n=1 Tax=Angiostrongylus costaricensis TaxID=334426 RepID=A0A0R3PGH6_ANGCS|nr:unnamed protein product [Angiostrongylus costaricensis]